MKASRKMVFGRYDYAAFLTFFTYASGSVVIPVALVMLARDLGFSLEAGGMSAGGALHFGRTIAMVGSLLLSGFAAGHWGTRRSLAFAALLMGLGMLLCAVAPVYAVLLAALFLAGCGEGSVEGLGTPFVRDLHEGDEPGRYINFTHGFWSVGVLVTVLISGALLTQCSELCNRPSTRRKLDRIAGSSLLRRRAGMRRAYLSHGCHRQSQWRPYLGILPRADMLRDPRRPHRHRLARPHPSGSSYASPLRKPRVSLTTTPERTTRAIRFGRAMRPLSVSETFQITSS